MTEDKDKVNIRKLDGKGGAKYFATDLSGGRKMIIGRETRRTDRRVWLSDADDWLQSHGYEKAGKGGLGTIDKLLDEWRGRAATDPEAEESGARCGGSTCSHETTKQPGGRSADEPRDRARLRSATRRSRHHPRRVRPPGAGDEAMGVPIVRIPVAGAMTATRRVRAMRAAFYTAFPGQPRWLFGIARLVDGRAVWDGPYGPEPSLFDVRWDPLERRLAIDLFRLRVPR